MRSSTRGLWLVVAAAFGCGLVPTEASSQSEFLQYGQSAAGGQVSYLRGEYDRAGFAMFGGFSFRGLANASLSFSRMRFGQKSTGYYAGVENTEPVTTTWSAGIELHITKLLRNPPLQFAVAASRSWAHHEPGNNAPNITASAWGLGIAGYRPIKVSGSETIIPFVQGMLALSRGPDGGDYRTADLYAFGLMVGTRLRDQGTLYLRAEGIVDDAYGWFCISLGFVGPPFAQGR